LRALFLLLLLANLLFLAWAQWIAPPATLAGQATPSAPDRKAIRLLREAPVTSRPAASGLPPTAGDVGPGATCVSAGPFLERAPAEVAASELARRGFKSRMRPSTDVIRVGQWVRVSNLATPEDAANALVALKAAGLMDAEIVGGDAPPNTISLGVFGDPARAAQVAATARKAGFSPDVSDRTRTADVFWLDVDRLENGSLPGLDALGPGAGPAAPPLEFRACPAPAAPAG
jgi:hypothetical protein